MADPNYPPPPYTPPYQRPPYPTDAAARKPRSARWISYSVIALAVLRLGLWLLPAAPKACDDADTQSSVEQAIDAGLKKAGQTITLTALSGFVTLRSTDDLKQCRAQGTFSDGEKQPVFYSVTGKEVRAKVGGAP